MRNRRLGQAGYLWALPLLTHSPGARAHYDHRRERGDSYNAAARNLANRYFGILFHCLQQRLTYDETKAFRAQSRSPLDSYRTCDVCPPSGVTRHRYAAW